MMVLMFMASIPYQNNDSAFFHHCSNDGANAANDDMVDCRPSSAGKENTAQKLAVVYEEDMPVSQIFRHVIS